MSCHPPCCNCSSVGYGPDKRFRRYAVAMPGPTIGELYKAKNILEADVAAAVDAFAGDLTLTTFLTG